MIHIAFKYKKWKIFTRTIERNLPTSYKEMTQTQFSALMKFVKGFITETEFYCRFFGVSVDILAQLDHFQLYKLTEHLHIEDKGCDSFVVKELCGLRAPADRLSDMSFQQFMTVDQLFGWYNYTENRKYLDQMLAALYVPKDADFFTSDWNERVALIREMQENDLYPAVVNWMLIKNWLTGVYTQIFSSAEPSSETRKDRKQKKPRPADWLSIFDAMVGDNLHLIDEYKHVDCMNALRYLNNKVKNNRFKKH